MDAMVFDDEKTETIAWVAQDAKPNSLAMAAQDAIQELKNKEEVLVDAETTATL